MTMSAPVDPDDRSDGAIQEIYAEFVRRHEGELAPDIAELCADYPQYADELRDLHGQQETIAQAGSSRTNFPHARVVQVQAKRYEIVKPLGHGGMGVVYQVWDGSLRRDLAMKLIRDKRQRKPQEPAVITNPESVARFIREAEITATLDHPGVVPIHDMGTDDQGRVFFTMRLVLGKRLDEVFELVRHKRERWSLTRALNVIVKICETLAFAHSRDVIHRDLKPANIMVGPFGETYVMDWGLAKQLAKSRSDGANAAEDWRSDPDMSLKALWNAPTAATENMETNVGAVMGTASYMPPEQAAGRIRELDERSDIYSVGAILYELLSGRRPYVTPGKPYKVSEIVQAIRQGPPEPIRSRNPHVSSELVAICEKAMTREQGQRYQSMQEMAEDLKAYLEDRVVRAYRTGAYAELRKWVVRNRGMAISSAIALLVAIGGLLAVVGVQSAANFKLTEANEAISAAAIRIEKEEALKGRALAEKSKALTEKEQSFKDEQAARKLANEHLRRAEGVLLARASSEVVQSNPALALRLALESAEHAPSYSANSAILAALPLHHEARTLYGHRGPIVAAALNSKGNRLVTASYDSTAIIWDLVAGNPIVSLVGHSERLLDVKFAADDSQIATASADHTAALWDAETGTRLHELNGHGGIVEQVCFSHNGQLVATGSLDGTARIWDAATGAQLHVLQDHAADVYQVAFSPDSRTLLTGAADRTARIWDALKGIEIARIADHGGGVGVAQFSPDGKQVLTVAARVWLAPSLDGRSAKPQSTDRAAHLSDAQTGKPLIPPLQHPEMIESATFNHDGSRVATGTIDGVIRIWDGASGTLLRTLEMREGPVDTVRFSPDSRLIAVSSKRGAVHLWNANTGEHRGRLSGHTDSTASIEFSSANQIVTASFDHTARIWNVNPHGSLPISLRKEESAATTPVISPDGKRLAVFSVRSPAAILCSFPEGERIAELEQDQPIESVQFSRWGRFVATVSHAGTVRLHAAIDGRLLKTLEAIGVATEIKFYEERQLAIVEHKSGTVTLCNLETLDATRLDPFPGMRSISMSPDGQYLAVRADHADNPNGLELLNIGSGARSIKLPAVTKSSTDLMQCRFSHNGRYLVTWTPVVAAPKVWETATGRLIAVLNDNFLHTGGVEFARDSKSFVTNRTYLAAQSWDSQTGRPLATFSGHETSNNRVFVAPRGERVVTRSTSKISRLWDGLTGKSLGVLADRDDLINMAVFSRDGKVLLTLNERRDKYSLWNSERGERMATIAGRERQFTSGVQSPDGEWLVSGLADGTARIWPVNPVKYMQSQELRPLTPDECDLFQTGSDTQRSDYRNAWNERALVEFLGLQTRAPTNSKPTALAARMNAERAIQEFMDGLSSALTKPQKVAALLRVEQTLRQHTEPSLATQVALASVFVDYGDFRHGEQLLRAVLSQGDKNDPSLWTTFAAINLGGLKRTPAEILAEFPNAQSPIAEDLKWILMQLQAGRVIRIGAGRQADYISREQVTWRHDCFFCGGKVFGEAFGNPQLFEGPIQNTADEQLYQAERWFEADHPATERGYRIPLQVGNYSVTLHLAEIFFHNPGSRVMDVLAEGDVVISNHESLAAGFATAEQKKFEVRVTDGLLNLEFRSVVDNPKVSAIEIVRLGD